LAIRVLTEDDPEHELSKQTQRRNWLHISITFFCLLQNIDLEVGYTYAFPALIDSVGQAYRKRRPYLQIAAALNFFLQFEEKIFPSLTRSQRAVSDGTLKFPEQRRARVAKFQLMLQVQVEGGI